MRRFVERAIAKIVQTIIDIKITCKYLWYGVPLEETETAKSYLREISPDSGNSCLIVREPQFEKRDCMLSIIIPAYNAEKYIVSCLESVLQQKVSFNYEIIVVNDGSIDATADILRNYEHNSKVCIVNQENQGASAARNTGISRAKGEYFYFLDCDDQLAVNSLEIMMEVAMKEKAKLVIGSYEKCSRDGRTQYITRLKDRKVENLALPGFAAGRVVHYSVFRNLCFPEGYWFEDSIMAQIVHPLCQTETYTVSNICYLYFSNEVGSTATSKGKAKSLDSLWITIRLLEERKAFQLPYTQHSYGYFLSMVNLTYHRTKALGLEVAKCVFAVQRMLLDKYYADYRYEGDRKKRKIEEALKSNNFRKYVLACEQKHK